MVLKCEKGECEKLKKYVALVNKRYEARAGNTKKVAGWQK